MTTLRDVTHRSKKEQKRKAQNISRGQTQGVVSKETQKLRDLYMTLVARKMRKMTNAELKSSIEGLNREENEVLNPS